MQLARVHRDEVYKTIGDLALAYDVYYPPDFVEGEPRPCVVFIHGEGPAEMLKDAKDWGQYVSWGQLAAASGLIGVTFNHRSSEWFTKLPEVASNVDDLMSHIRQNAVELGIDPERMGIWVCSGGTPVGLRMALREGAERIRCCAVYYGRTNLEMMRAKIKPEATDEVLREFSPELLLREMDAKNAPPLFIARAGKDSLPMVNETLHRFVALAIEKNVMLEFMNHPDGEHGFDFLNNDERSREIIGRTLAFLRWSLPFFRKGADPLQKQNALKHRPGEIFFVDVVRKGKDPFQGVGFLDDGSMVLVDGGDRHIGETLQVRITEYATTPTGEYILWAKIVDEEF
jgi:acetyl esterase/lipase